MLRRSAPFALVALLGCASDPQIASIDAPVVEPAAGEAVVIDHLVTLYDASSSVSARSQFRDEKALAQSFARAMPDGDYETAAIGFGGFRRDTAELAPFDRGSVVRYTEELPHLAEGTPIHKALDEAGAALEGKSGRAAVVLYSDGQLTDEIGREIDAQLALDAAARIREGYDGPVCIHTVQIGGDTAGGEFLRSLAESSECGSFRRADGVTSVAALSRFEREVFLGASATPDVAAAPRDTDADGVIDPDDLCPDSPRGAAVDGRGCWVVRGLLFPVDGSQIDASGKRGLDEVAQVLRANPNLRVQIGGHTDSSGSDAYNRALSDRRAEAARTYLVSAGIAASRLEAEGFGESKPAADNTTAEGRQANRRTEINIVR